MKTIETAIYEGFVSGDVKVHFGGTRQEFYETVLAEAVRLGHEARGAGPYRVVVFGNPMSEVGQSVAVLTADDMPENSRQDFLPSFNIPEGTLGYLGDAPAIRLVYGEQPGLRLCSSVARLLELCSGEFPAKNAMGTRIDGESFFVGFAQGQEGTPRWHIYGEGGTNAVLQPAPFVPCVELVGCTLGHIRGHAAIRTVSGVFRIDSIEQVVGITDRPIEGGVVSMAHPDYADVVYVGLDRLEYWTLSNSSFTQRTFSPRGELVPMSPLLPALEGMLVEPLTIDTVITWQAADLSLRIGKQVIPQEVISRVMSADTTAFRMVQLLLRHGGEKGGEIVAAVMKTYRPVVR